MKKQSAGILLYRTVRSSVEVLIVHPGGPFWAKRDLGAWSVPKGEFGEGEEPLAAAKREFQEETGAPAPAGDYRGLGEAKQSSGKTVYVFALEHDFDLERFSSNMFSMEWPPKSGVQQEFPECDRAAWIPLSTAKQKLVKGQMVFIDRLAESLEVSLDAGNTQKPDAPAQASLF